MRKNDPLRMAGATAFFTTFALPPILIIIIQALSLIFDPQSISDKLFKNLDDYIGQKSTEQMVSTLTVFRNMASNWWVTAAGILFLFFVSTTLFQVIKNSLNQVWKVKVVRKKKLKAMLRNRAQAILVILVIGVLFSVGIIIEALQAFLGKYLQEGLPQVSGYFKGFLSYIFSVVMVTLWFAMIFRYLPDARPTWKVTFVGAVFTSILFNIGKYLLRWLLTYSNIDTLYGTSASIVLLLLFVFYTSLIFYFGAAFTKVWALHNNMPIRPANHAIHYSLQETNLEND